MQNKKDKICDFLQYNYILLFAKILPLPTRQLSERIMIEYSQPNTHKSFHVGHLRNAVFGDSLVRLYKMFGHHDIAANYFGDQGIHVAKCLWNFQRKKLTIDDIPKSGRIDFFGQLYTEAEQLLSCADSNLVDLKKQVDGVLRLLESKNGAQSKNCDNNSNSFDISVKRLWYDSSNMCIAEFEEIYKWLDCHFDHRFLESEFSTSSIDYCRDLLERNILTLDDGAVIADLTSHKLGRLVLIKSNGSGLYATKDLVLAQKKI